MSEIESIGLITKNADIASRLQDYAALLEQQGEDSFRVRAYQEAANHVRMLPVGLQEIFTRDGLAGLIALPKIGWAIASAIAEMMTSGRWPRLDRRRGDAAPARLADFMFCKDRSPSCPQ